MEAEKKQKAPKKNRWKGLQAEFKKVIWPDKQTLVKQTVIYHCCCRSADCCY